MLRRTALFAAVVCLATAMQAESPRSQQIQLPMSFEQNRGQTDSEVHYLARARNSTVFFTPGEVVLSLYSRTNSNRAEASVLRLQWVGANRRPKIAGEEYLAGRINYMVGSDPAKWRLNLPTYARVRYRGIYPGVDAVFYGRDGEVEYDLNLAPRGDLNKLRMSFSGARAMHVADNGDLVLSLDRGEVRQRLPHVYQIVEGKRRTLQAKHVIHDDKTVGFSVQGADPKRALVIDPVLSYSTYLGSNTPDEINSIAVDQFGRAYVTGTTTYSFPTKNPAQGNQPGLDAFVTKFWANGQGLIYSTILGSSGWDRGHAIAVDRFGHAYVGGFVPGDGFPAVPGSYDPPEVENGNVGFVAKLSPSGSSLVYVARMGMPVDALALDSQRRAYIVGSTCLEGFPLKNAYQPNYRGQPCSSGGGNGIFMRLNAAGSDIDYGTYLGGNIADSPEAIVVDSTFHAYITGWTSSPEFPITPGAFQTEFKAETTPDFPHDIPGMTTFVTKFAADGQSLVYSTFLGGTSDDVAHDIAVDADGRAYVAGSASSTDFPVTAGAYRTTFQGSGEAFVTKLWKDGKGLIYSTFLGGSGGEGAGSIAVDSQGRAEVAGSTNSNNFPVRSPLQAALAGGSDAFVTKLTASGRDIVFSTYLGGTGTDFATAIRLDADGNAYIGGATNSSTFPTAPGAYSRTYKGGGNDAWVAKIIH